MAPTQPNKLPNWLTEPEPPLESASKATFFQRNQHHLRQLLTKLAQPTPVIQPTRWPIAAHINLIRLLIMVLLIAIINNLALLWCLGLILAGQLLWLPPQQLRTFVKSWLISSLVALIIVLPSYWLTGPATLLFFGCKTSLILANAQYYRLTTTFNDLLVGLKTLRCPDILIMTLAIAITYLRMLGQYLLLTLEALDLRTVASTKHPYQLIGALFGNLYLKSYAYALELYAAMEARGFNGHYVRAPQRRSHWRDYLSLSPDLVALILLILWGN